MSFEVEQKFAVADVAGFREMLAQASVTCVRAQTITQTDTYFSHPSRDFVATDEALRLRQIEPDSILCVTYKGPKLDAHTKTRKEIELPFLPGTSLASASELLESLQFKPVRIVAKQREVYHWEDRDGTAEICLDNVVDLGWFAEIEILTEAADLDSARSRVHSIANQLGLAGPIRESYLQLLLQREQGT